MGVDSKHPLYLDFEPDWRQLRDTYRGERQVKERGKEYLPPTAGMIVDGANAAAGTEGGRAYASYLKRAVFPELVKPAVETMLGVMHHKPPAIELPGRLEEMLERATLRGESLEMLLRRINEEQLIGGRVGLLLEIPDSADGVVTPFIAVYRAEHMINWDEGTRDETVRDSLNLVVLDESENERKADFEWEHVAKYRVLVLGDVDANEAVGVPAVYRVGVFKEDATFDESKMVEPSISGRRMERIPFVFINTNDVVPTPDDAPLLGLSNLALTVYRTEADYRRALFVQGEDTLVTIGDNRGDDAIRIGAGASIDLPMGGDAKFIGVDSAGLPELRQALENDYTRGEQRASGLLEAVSRSAESGEALRVRVSARTASLNQIAMTSAFGLQEILRMAAEWVGANPDEVIVTPNLDFVADRLPGAELTGYMAAKGLGAPLSLESIHEQMQDRGLTTLTWDEEQARLEAESQAGLPGAVPAGLNDDEGATDDGAPVNDDDDEADSDDE